MEPRRTAMFLPTTKEEVKNKKFIVKTNKGVFGFYVYPKLERDRCIWKITENINIDGVKAYAIIEKINEY